MTKYEQFQEWLNKCPVEIENYLDYTDTFQVTFKVPVDEAVEELAHCIVDTNGAYAECVDHLVETMGEDTTNEWYDEDGRIKHVVSDS
tara:strand:- start:109 stop:372 length:264 start_codon:yes stop_codon:yes gene_type:complete